MLFQLQQQKVIDSLPKNAEYIIYIYIDDHYSRCNTDTFDVINDTAPYLKYEMNNDKLKLKKYKYPVLWRFYWFKIYRQHKYDNQIATDLNLKKYNQQLIEQMFLESNNLIKKNFPNAKFVIIKYRQNPEYNWDSFDFPLWQNLKKKGIIIIDTSELSNVDLSKTPYIVSETDIHPSSQAWSNLVPNLVKKLHL